MKFIGHEAPIGQVRFFPTSEALATASTDGTVGGWHVQYVVRHICGVCYIHIRRCTCIYIYTRTYTYIHVHMYIHMYVHTYGYICTYVQWSLISLITLN